MRGRCITYPVVRSTSERAPDRRRRATRTDRSKGTHRGQSPEQTSRYTVVADERLEVGQEVELPTYAVWRVVEIEPSVGHRAALPMPAASFLKLAGIAVCEGLCQFEDAWRRFLERRPRSIHA
jgi:hypothetical protein